MRCLTLADELKKSGSEVLFITRAHKGHLAEAIKSHGYEVRLLQEPAPGFRSLSGNTSHAEWLGVGWEQDAAETIQAFHKKKPDWLVVDHYALDVKWHKAMRNSVRNILVIDDLADRKLDCELLLDQTFGREAGDYLRLVPENCLKLLGTRYALLRPEFSELRSQAVAKRKRFDVVRHVLVSMGGTDPANVTSTVLRGLAKVRFHTPLQVEVVLGSKAPHLEDIRQQSNDHPFNVTVSIDVKDMGKRMLNSDLAIGAGGTTSWERCCLGLPTLTISIAENQDNIIKNIVKFGASIQIGDSKRISDSDIKNAVQNLCEDEVSMIELSNRCFQIVDGFGLGRVAKCMEDLL